MMLFNPTHSSIVHAFPWMLDLLIAGEHEGRLVEHWLILICRIIRSVLVVAHEHPLSAPTAPSGGIKVWNTRFEVTCVLFHRFVGVPSLSELRN